MIYKISNATQKTWQDKKFVEAELIDTNGELFKVSAWAGEFDGKAEIDTELEKNEKGYWRMKKTEKPRAGGNSGFKTAQIEKVMDTKRQDISKFQDNKEYSIKLASTLRMAVDLTIAMTPDQRETTMEETVRKWRTWLWEEWDLDIKSTSPFLNVQENP